MNTPKDFYYELTDKIGELLFGLPEAHHAYPYRTLVDAWLKQNKLGPDDIERWFSRVHDDRTLQAEKAQRKLEDTIRQNKEKEKKV